MMQTLNEADVIVVGGGVAGAAAAWALAPHRRVLLLERESQPGYHTTGRSAALMTPFYGNDTVRRLNIAGHAFYKAPPAGFGDGVLLRPRGALMIGRAEQGDQVAADLEGVRALGGAGERLDQKAALALVPELRPEAAVHAWLDRSAADMEVATILQGFLAGFRHRGGRLVTDAEVGAIGRDAGAWEVETGKGVFTAPVLIDAAGAWADPVAEMAGLGPLDIQPKRRTVILIDPPAGSDSARWPAVADIDDTVYFKPDAGRLLCSPADETPSPPMDAWPEEMDVALCAERVEGVLQVEIRRIAHQWAGLRCFAPDRTPVAGFDPRAAGFFWLAGQGGYGIMTAPSLAAITALLVADVPLPPALGLDRFDLAALAPARLLAG